MSAPSTGAGWREDAVFYVSPDDDGKPASPTTWARQENRSLLVDLTDDGVLEVLIGTADGEVLALYGDGTVEGWPVAVDTRVALTMAAYVEGEVTAGTRDSFIGTVAAGDIDGDGRDEIIGATLFGGVYAWRADGSPTTSDHRSQQRELDAVHFYDQGSRVHPRCRISTGSWLRSSSPAWTDASTYPTERVRLGAIPHRRASWHGGAGYADLMCGSEGDRSITSAMVADVDNDGDFGWTQDQRRCPVGQLRQLLVRCRDRRACSRLAAAEQRLAGYPAGRRPGAPGVDGGCGPRRRRRPRDHRPSHAWADAHLVPRWNGSPQPRLHRDDVERGPQRRRPECRADDQQPQLR